MSFFMFVFHNLSHYFLRHSNLCIFCYPPPFRIQSGIGSFCQLIVFIMVFCDWFGKVHDLGKTCQQDVLSSHLSSSFVCYWVSDVDWCLSELVSFAVHSCYFSRELDIPKAFHIWLEILIPCRRIEAQSRFKAVAVFSTTSFVPGVPPVTYRCCLGKTSDLLFALNQT